MVKKKVYMEEMYWRMEMLIGEETSNFFWFDG
jgi:hypothetical protein